MHHANETIVALFIGASILMILTIDGLRRLVEWNRRRRP